MPDSLKYIQVREFFYIENGKFKAFINSGSLTFPWSTSTGSFLGFKTIFYSCINNNNQDQFELDPDVIDLGVSMFKFPCNLDVSSFDSPNRQTSSVQLKSVYNYDLADELCRLISNGKVKLYDMKNDSLISHDSLKNYSLMPEYVEYKYDIKGNIIDSVIFKRQFNPGSITSVHFAQHFYFNKKQNLVFSTISEIYLNRRFLEEDETPTQAKEDAFAPPGSWAHREVCFAKITFE